MKGHGKKWNLIKLNAYYDPTVHNWYLHAVYDVISEYKTERIDIPRILLPISSYPVLSHSCTYPGANSTTIDLGFGELDVHKGKFDKPCTITTIEERAEEVTMEDIEKKFGHKVKIVANPKLEDLL